MTEGQIARSLMFRRYRRSFVLPNYAPPQWWECDVFELTQSGFFTEYEIKLTVSDFRADARKERERRQFPGRPWESVKKHELLQRHDPKGPNRFFYVTPEGLLAKETLPDWAGLIEVRPWRDTVVVMDVLRRNAPRLHSEKARPRLEDHCRSIPYYRMHDLLFRLQPNDTPPVWSGAEPEPD